MTSYFNLPSDCTIHFTWRLEVAQSRYRALPSAEERAVMCLKVKRMEVFRRNTLLLKVLFPWMRLMDRARCVCCWVRASVCWCPCACLCIALLSVTVFALVWICVCMRACACLCMYVRAWVSVCVYLWIYVRECILMRAYLCLQRYDQIDVRSEGMGVRKGVDAFHFFFSAIFSEYFIHHSINYFFASFL